MKTASEHWDDLTQNESRAHALEIVSARDTEWRQQVTALDGIVDTERQLRKETENTLFFVRKDLQKLKGELAEALRLLGLGAANTGLWPELRVQFRAFLAVPPADAAPHANDCTPETPSTACNHSSHSPLPGNEGELTEAQPSVSHAKQLASQRAHAEQARGEAVPRCTCGSGAHPRSCETHPWAFGHHVEGLSRETLADDVAALATRVDALEAWRKQWVDYESARNPETR